MKKPLFRFVLTLCVFCILAVFAAAAAEDSLHTLPVEIIRVTPGKDAGFVMRNRGTDEITSLSFRIRGTDEEGKPVSFPAGDAEAGGEGSLNVALYNAHITSVVLPGDIRDIRIENGYQGKPTGFPNPSFAGFPPGTDTRRPHPVPSGTIIRTPPFFAKATASAWA